ncbi:MAG: arginine decarboxylase, pyruvoyl-dependent [bacterium]|nr:arginine decarboxylase, pyruvoyl-dependent [bacterium]
MFVPSRMFLVRGVGTHEAKLSSFELALRKADIAQFNLVRVSSIFPPHCRIISRKEGLKELSDGQIVFAVLSESATNEPNRLIAASVGVAIPKDRSRYGYLSEHHSYGETNKQAGEFAEDLAAEMLATSLGLEFDPLSNWDEKEDLWKISGLIVKTQHITQSAVGDRRGLWRTVVTGAILLP